MRTKPAVWLAFIIAAIVVGVLAFQRQQSAREAARHDAELKAALEQQARERAAKVTVPAVPEPPPAREIANPPAATGEIRPAKTDGRANVQTPPPANLVVPAGAAGNGGPADPLAREALSLVGADPDSEAYWIGAINDPSLSDNERQNLIEDLNEDGLSDPQNPSPQDLPLIMNRLQLIEELAPDAMDQVNWDAFMEAYKDLWNMYVRLTQQQ